MLRFIFKFWIHFSSQYIFQYIPCYGLSWKRQTNAEKHTHISIHPMLRFITVRNNNPYRLDKFQYIPCYGLSKWDWFVTLTFSEFQYIPCYGLSHHNCYFSCHSSKFQYIPCYGLSYTLQDLWVDNLLFQYIPCYGLSLQIPPTPHPQTYFNTSHVTVYRVFNKRNRVGVIISIHPMLRFISENQDGNGKGHRISIHPMLRFIYSTGFS